MRVIRLWFPLAVTLVFLVGSSETTPSSKEDVATQPLSELPSGWTHLGSRNVDVWRGAYHDLTSGAYVIYLVGPKADEFVHWRSQQNSDPQDIFSEGRIEGIPYKTIDLSGDARTRVIRTLQIAIGENLQEFDPLVERSFPPSKSRLFVVTFYPENRVEKWSFTSATCSDLQRERVKELLLTKLRLSFDSADSLKAEERRRIKSEQLGQVEEGISVKDVLRLLGEPREFWRVSTDGFALAYDVLNEAGVFETRLLFGRDQRLVRMEESRP
jgi:hypothetical protein